MATTKAHVRYKNSEGVAVPGVTTVCNLLDDGKSGAFAYVAWEFGMKGLDYKKEWAKKRDCGTLTHYLIDCDNKEIDADNDYIKDFPQNIIDKAETGFLGFLDWKKHNVKEVLGSEIQLVDSDLGFGGTIDMPFIDMDDQLVLGDHKTGKVYDSTSYQIAPYEHLWNIHNERKINKKIVLQIDKEEGLITPIPLGDLSIPFEIFKNLLGIYYLQKRLKNK